MGLFGSAKQVHPQDSSIFFRALFSAARGRANLRPGHVLVGGCSSLTWGRDKVILDTTLAQLSRVATFSDLELALHATPVLAKAILCLPPALDRVAAHLSLNMAQRRTICALGIEFVRENELDNGSDDTIFLTEQVRGLFEDSSIEDMYKHVQKIVDTEAGTAAHRIGMFVRDGPEDDPVWLVDMKQSLSAKPRNLLFPKNVKPHEVTRAYMAVLYGLDSAEITFLLTHGSADTDATISKKMARARLLLAAGALPEPAVYGESRK